MPRTTRGPRPSLWPFLLPVLSILVLLAGAGCAEPPAALVYRMPQDPPSLDPHRTNDESSLVYIVNIFDGLVEFAPGSLEIAPGIAESWTISQDGLTYTFRLRPEALFHNGRRIEPRDVAYSMERALDPRNPSPLRSILEMIEGAEEYGSGAAESIAGVTLEGEGTVAIRLKHPFGPFLTALAGPIGGIVPSEIYEDASEGYLDRPVGSGPFMMETWERGISISLTAFEDHWKGRAGVPRILFRFIPNAMTALEEYKTGGIQINNEVPSGQRRWVRENLGEEYRVWPRLATAFIGFNHVAGPFAGNPVLRRALNFAVDRDRIAEVIQEGKDRATSAILPPGLPGHDSAGGPYRYDPEESRRLLAEAGYPGGEGLPELVYLTGSNEAIRRYAEAVQSDMERVGVRVRIRALEFAAYIQAMTGSDEAGPDADLFQLIYYADYPDPDGMLRPLLHTSSFGMGGNFGRYSSAEVDRLLDQGRRVSAPEERAQLYREAERIALQDACVIPIYHYGDDALVKSSVEGFHPSPLGDFAVPLELLRSRP